MKMMTEHKKINLGTLMLNPKLSLKYLILMAGVSMSYGVHAQLAADVFPVEYQANQYCRSDIQPIVPRGTPNEQLVADISCMRQRLLPYQDQMQPTIVQYQAHKAQAWLSYIAHEKSEASLTKAGKYALQEVLSILYALENQQVDKIPVTTDIPPTSGLKRPDLWASILTIKQTPAFDKLTKNIANSEVKLMWAEAEFCEFGWRHSREHFSAAERWVHEAELTALNHEGININRFNELKQKYLEVLMPLENNHKACQGVAVPYVSLPELPKPMVVVQEPAPQLLPVVVPAKVLLKPAVVHFALDKSVLDDRSQAVIDELLQQVGQQYSLSELTFKLYGHTDSRASIQYNAALSKRRTGSVASYLMSKGILIDQIEEYPEGKMNLKRTETDNTSHALNRRVEIYLFKNGEPVTDEQLTQEVLSKMDYVDLKVD